LFLVLGLAIGTPGGILIARYVIPPQTQAVYVSVPAKTKPTFHTVKYVTDGDTFVLTTGEKVLMVGVNTPESVGRKREYYGKEASNFTKQMLAGKRVRLEKDETSGDRDGFGRMLRYVRLEDGTDYGLMLIEKGYDRVAVSQRRDFWRVTRAGLRPTVELLRHTRTGRDPRRRRGCPKFNFRGAAPAQGIV
jgi:endonuclease YncB( thermonuclease family)